uniref:Glycosyltransferase n=1 Tax=Fagopyrum esculentum TaxID=3617 RepID=A0A0A1H7L0_FAGES|nr:UDP-glycose: glycosyltransferase UGT92J1 [Fagopyrum esculentum]
MEKERRQHVLIFPFMAQGHIIPFLALALEIEKRNNYQITFINTPLNINKLRSSLPPDSTIRLRSIPFDSTRHGLPPNTENTDALPYNLIFRLMEASFTLESDLRTLLEQIVHQPEETHPLCIITDMFFAWVGRVAHQFGIYHAIFSGTSAFGLACYYSLWSTVPNWKVHTSPEFFEMEDFPEGGKIHITQMPPSMASADGKDPWSIFQRKMCAEYFNIDAILFNTVDELDRIGLDYFRRKLRRPAWAIGPILNQDRVNNDGGSCKTWLDSKSPRSVIYVCFGSQNTLTGSQMMEMAMALEESGRFFIWVVRPPLGKEFADEMTTEDWLPAGFEKRVEGRGLIVRKWAPQVEILSHGSTGAFISHCGWNSTLEAISYGVPIISWPMAGEQFFNVKLLEGELGICVELGRGNGCEVECRDIMRKIEMVMGEDEGAKKVRLRASEVRKIIADAKRDEEEYKGSSLRAIDEFFVTAIARRDINQNNSQV